MLLFLCLKSPNLSLFGVKELWVSFVFAKNSQWGCHSCLLDFRVLLLRNGSRESGSVSFTTKSLFSTGCTFFKYHCSCLVFLCFDTCDPCLRFVFAYQIASSNGWKYCALLSEKQVVQASFLLSNTTLQ